MKKILILFVYLASLNAFIKPYILPIGLTINPYGKTPLSATYRLPQKNLLPLTVTVIGKKRDASIIYTYPVQYGEIFAIHGLYAQHTNQLILSLGQERILNTNIIIGDVYKDQKLQYPNTTPSRIRVHKDLFPTMDPFNQDLYFIYDNFTNIVAYDKRGDLRYLYQKDNAIHMMSRIEQQNNNFYFYFVDKKMVRGNLLGQEKFFPARNISVHHEFISKKTHKIILALSTTGGLEDRIIEVNPLGYVVRDLILGDVFRNTLPLSEWTNLNKTVYDSNNVRSNRITLKPEHVDWAHLNSFVYDEDKDILYLSARHLGIIAVDYSEWTLLWWMSDPRLSIKKGKSYGEVPSDFVYLHKIESLKPYQLKSTTYPKAQHSLLLRSNGNLLVFDNQGDSDINFGGSRVLEYEIIINDDQREAKLIRNIRHPKRVYSRLLSDVDLIDKDNFLVLWGYDTPLTFFKTARLSEFDAQGELIFDMSLGVDWVYRVEKKPLYPYRDPLKKYSIDFHEKEEL